MTFIAPTPPPKKEKKKRNFKKLKFTVPYQVKTLKLYDIKKKRNKEINK